MMIKKISFLVLFLIIGINSNSQGVELNECIEIIRKNFNSVNDNLASFKKISFDVYESAEGGVVTIYKDEDTIVKIKEEHYGETGKVIINSYFIDGKLSFIFRQYYEYNAPIYYDKEIIEDGVVFPAFDPKKTKISEDRYYFYNNKLIRWINPNKEFIDKKSEDFKAKEKELLEFNESLVEKIKKKS